MDRPKSTEEPARNHTPLYDIHMALGGQIVDFAGWALPLQYEGLIPEHQAVRERAGLFDVSHMAQIIVSGPDAGHFLDALLTRPVSSLPAGQAVYALLCAEDGGALDDLVVLLQKDGSYLLIANAANRASDMDWLLQHKSGCGECTVTDRSDDFAMLALQGPQADAILQSLGVTAQAGLPVYHFLEDVSVAGAPALLSRTGYTGEDGFELIIPTGQAESVWNALLHAQPVAPKPCGLGCRDTLRFEAGMPLYGNELGRDITPLEAGLKRFVDFENPSFIGRDALLRQAQDGPPRKLIGFEVTGRGIARHGYPVYDESNGQQIGQVTTGYPSPTLGRNLGVALVSATDPAPERLSVGIRTRHVPIEVRSRFFYKRKGRTGHED